MSKDSLKPSCDGMLKSICEAGETTHGSEVQTVMCGRNTIPNQITRQKLNLKEKHCKHHIVQPALSVSAPSSMLSLLI